MADAQEQLAKLKGIVFERVALEWMRLDKKHKFSDNLDPRLVLLLKQVQTDGFIAGMRFLNTCEEEAYTLIEEMLNDGK